MREIKFRAWNGEKMLEQISLYWDGSKFITGIWNFEETHVVEEDAFEPIVMQYTGLKDKNGVECYEGDIVVWKVDTELSSGHDNIDKVTFAGGAFHPIAWPTHTCYYHVDKPEFEVIGNIHQNPELLES